MKFCSNIKANFYLLHVALSFMLFSHAEDLFGQLQFGTTFTSEGSDGRKIAYPSGWFTSEGSDGRKIAYPSGWFTSEGSDGRKIAYPSGWFTSEGSDGRKIAYQNAAPASNANYQDLKTAIFITIYQKYPSFDPFLLMHSMGYLDDFSGKSSSSFDSGYAAASRRFLEMLGAYNVSTLPELYEKGKIDGAEMVGNSLNEYIEAFLAEYNATTFSELYEKGKSEGEKQGKNAVKNDPAAYNLISQSVYEKDVLNADNNSVINYTTGWFYQQDRGWMWTNNDTLPWVYSVSDGWLFFKRDGEKNRVYRNKTKEWKEID